MALATVHIRKEAFLILAWSAIETFKKECFGFLFGRSPTEKNNFFHITDVVPFQCARYRKNIGYELNERAEKKFEKFIATIGNAYPKYLGDFHSHPEWGGNARSAEMSELDLSRFSKTPEPLEFIIEISSRKKGRAPWEVFSDGSIGGSFGKFNLNFKIYTLVPNAEGEILPSKLQIVAPRAIKTLNRINLK